MVSMLLLSSTTYAVELDKTHNQVAQMTTMSKSEAIQMLKDAGVEPSKIKMLENGEMAKTEGEFWWFLLPIIAGIAGGVATHYINQDAQRSPVVPGFYYEDPSYPGFRFNHNFKLNIATY